MAAHDATLLHNVPVCPPVYTVLHQRNPPLTDIPAFCEPGFFFNEGVHLRQQANGAFHLITALNQRTQQAAARCAFFIEPDGAVSPGAAPFGSVEFAETLPDSVLEDLLQVLIDKARATGAPTLRLVNYPHCYAPHQANRLMAKLTEQNFRLVRTDLTSYLPVEDNAFVANLHPSERRRLRKCRRAGFRFSHNAQPNLETVVNFLHETRQRQNYPLTLSPERLTDLLTRFPGQFPVFSVMNGATTAALIIAVRVQPDILYAFLPASCPDYRTFSPMVMLIDGLYAYCQQQNIRLLDLGVSLDADRQPKPSLMRFKQNLGALSSPKMIFEKVL